MTAPTIKRAYLAWIVVCIVWGTTYLGIRIALETMPPFLMAAFRWLVAGAVLVAVYAARGDRIAPPRAWLQLAPIGVLMMGFGNGGVVWAEQTVPSGLTAVLVAVAPFWMVGTERFMRDREALTGRKIAGLMLGFAGVVLLVWPELRLGKGRGFLIGVAATQCACLGWAIGSSLLRRREHDENVLAAAALQMVFAGAALLAVGTMIGEWAALTFNPRTIAALIYLITVGSIVGYSAYTYALKHLPVSTVSLYAYANPVIAVVLGWLILAEPFGWRIVAAVGVILAGSAMVKSEI